MPVLNPDLLLFCAVAIAAGGIVGLLGGLLGIGGGLVLVPVLYELIQGFGAGEATAVRAAIGTSLATVVITGARSALSHYRRGAFDRALFLAWAPAVVLGAMLGAEIANRVETSMLITFFAIMTVFLAANMAFGRSEWRLGDTPPGRTWRLPGGGIVGLISGMLGLGVAGLGVPLMMLFNAPVLAAVSAAALLGAVAAVPATIRFIVAGWGLPDLAPWSLGYVNLPGFALIASMTLITAPIGVAWSHRCPQQVLKRVFAAFLAINALRMLVF